MLNLKQAIMKLSRSQASVYIFGESGSGKELVARSIHTLGPRQNHPFIPVNCGAIPAELMESEFFGHKKGAFTGATQDKQGLFQAADTGTLFLDEVADLPLGMQVKLLRAIQEKAIRPVGRENEIKIDVRILCASHKDLESLVASGQFRQDLFYRLNVIQVSVPALRERGSDIELLVNKILQRTCALHNLPIPTLTANARKALLNYRYPGNIRELENILERAFTLCEENTIDEQDLQLVDKPIAQQDQKLGAKLSHYDASQNHASIDDYLLEVEKEILCGTLESTRWNKTLAAKKLGISFRSLRYRLQKLGLDTED